jgi:hypothetical protein
MILNGNSTRKCNNPTIRAINQTQNTPTIKVQTKLRFIVVRFVNGNTKTCRELGDQPRLPCIVSSIFLPKRKQSGEEFEVSKQKKNLREKPVQVAFRAVFVQNQLGQIVQWPPIHLQIVGTQPFGLSQQLGQHYTKLVDLGRFQIGNGNQFQHQTDKVEVVLLGKLQVVQFDVPAI